MPRLSTSSGRGVATASGAPGDSGPLAQRRALLRRGPASPHHGRLRRRDRARAHGVVGLGGQQ
eukprot:11477727-Alexandrium_andersonii.AAC.1